MSVTPSAPQPVPGRPVDHQSVESANHPHRPSRVRRAIAASGVVGALGLGSLGVGSLAAAPLALGAAAVAGQSVSASRVLAPAAPVVRAGTGRFDVISGGS